MDASALEYPQFPASFELSDAFSLQSILQVITLQWWSQENVLWDPSGFFLPAGPSPQMTVHFNHVTATEQLPYFLPEVAASQQ